MPENTYVQSITLATELDRRVAFADAQVGDVTIHGIAVFRTSSGRLRVYFPSYKSFGGLYPDSVEVPPETRSEIEAEVLAAYRTRKKEFDREAESRRIQESQQPTRSPAI